LRIRPFKSARLAPVAVRHRLTPTVPTFRRLARTVRATEVLALLSIASLAACAADDSRLPTAPAHAAVAAPAFEIVPVTAGGGGIEQPGQLDFATYDGSRQVVHPDVLRAPEAWGGQLLSVITPYPNSQARYENPSIFSSTSGETWEPVGSGNPVATTARGYLSDPDVVYDPSRNQMRLYFREVVMSGKRHIADNVYYMTSPDGVAWSSQMLATTDRGRYVVSPSVVRGQAGTWRMWAVDAGSRGCNANHTKLLLRVSTDGVNWTAGKAASFSQPGYVAWHVDVEWVDARREYWALVAAYPRGASCTATSLFLATSADGEKWTTYPAPVLARGTVPQFDSNVYRSSLLFDDDGTVTLWMSGARTTIPGTRRTRPTLEWSAAVARTTATALLARVSRAASVALDRAVPSAVMSAANDFP